MADYRDIVTNQDMVLIANAIRHASRTTTKMTVPQMPERLSKLRVVEWSKKTINFATGEAATIGAYSTDFKHMFLVSPCSIQDAESLSTVDPELGLKFDEVTGVLSLPFSRNRDVDVGVFVIDMLLADDADNGGMLVPFGEGSGRVEAYDATKAYRAGDLYVYQNLLGLTLVDHEAEAFDTSHNVVFASKEAVDALFNRVSAIEILIPAQASYSNKLADKDFVNSSINSMAAYFITKNAQGDPFATKAELDATTVFYSGGVVRVPTQNDYCLVIADETKVDPVTLEAPTTRYIYQNDRFEYQYTVNKTPLTAAQLAALNSGITALKVSDLDANTLARHSHTNKDVLDLITAAFKTEDKTALDTVVQQAVRVVDQSLTEQQKAKARANIGAVSETTSTDEQVQSVELGEDGIAVAAQVTDTNKDGTVTRAKTYKVPVGVGEGLSAEVSADGKSVLVDTVGTKKVAIQLQSETQVQGTLSNEDYATLTADHSNYVETSYGDDKKRYDFEGESSTHLEYAYKHDEGGVFSIESFKIDKSTRDWAVLDVEIQEKLTFDSAPTEGSTNPVTSGGVHADQVRQDVTIQKTAIRTHNLERVVFGAIATEGDESYQGLKSSIIPSSIEVGGSQYPVYDGISSPLSKVEGNTKQFNQLVKKPNSDIFRFAQHRCTVSDKTETSFKASSIGNENWGGIRNTDNNRRIIVGHKYYLQMGLSDIGYTDHLSVHNGVKEISDTYVYFDEGVNKTAKIVFTSDKTTTDFYIRLMSGNLETGKSITVSDFMLFDLTAMGLDSITTVEEFNALYPKAYYEYNAGTLYDSVVSGVSLTGRNFWDEQWEAGGINANGTNENTANAIRCINYIKVLPTVTYYFKLPINAINCYVVQFDAYKKFIIRKYVNRSNPTITLGNNCYYIRFYVWGGSSYDAVYQNDICINISDPSFNGQYEPYRISTISLPSTQTLGGVGTAQDEIQVTKNENDDYYTIKKIQRVGYYTFSSSDKWYYHAVSDTLVRYQTPNIENVKPISKGGNMICSNLQTVKWGMQGITTDSDGKVTVFVTITDYPDDTAFKDAMNGVMLTYELVTPVETTLTETATLAEVSAIRENGGMISVVGNTNEDYVQPDVEIGILYSKTAQ